MATAMSPRNRTITLDNNAIRAFCNMCIVERKKYNLHEIINSVINGDLFTVAENLPSNFVDLLVVDPPYNLSKNYSESNFKEMSTTDYYRFTDKWISAIKHTLKQTASIYVCCDWKSSMIIGQVLDKHFNIQNRITWQREKGRGALSNWKNSMEDIWFCTNSKNDYTFNVENVKMRRKVIAPYKIDGKPKDWQETEFGNFRDTYPSNFWDDITIPYWSMPENTNHPTQKPEKLIAKLILASSNVNDIVFDPFLGSGTTAVVAKKLGRNYVGIELENEYCAVSQKRLLLAETNKEIQGYTNGVFWERNTLNEQQKIANSGCIC